MTDSQPTIVHADNVLPQPWRNGCGQTRELLTWPPGTDWQVRISRADIEADGPFSAFDGVQRWFVVLEGAGVALQFADGQQLLHLGDAPFEFDGANAPQCTLLDGPTQDLNLMVRNGQGLLQAVTAGKSWQSVHVLHGLYTRSAGIWRHGTQQHALAAHTLLWNHGTHALPWSFEPSVPSAHAQAWWLGFTPAN